MEIFHLEISLLEELNAIMTTGGWKSYGEFQYRH